MTPQNRGPGIPSDGIPPGKMPCRWCGAPIEQLTVERNRGRCTPCSRKRYLSFLILDKLLPYLHRRKIERCLANSTLEQLRPSAEEVKGAMEFANHFDPTGEFAKLIELGATKPEDPLVLEYAPCWMKSGCSLKKIVGLEEKEKAHLLYRQNRLLRDLLEEYLLERDLGTVYDYDAPSEELVERLSALQTAWTSNVDWPLLKEQMAKVEGSYEAVTGISKFLGDIGLSILPLHNDPNDIWVVVRTADIPKIQQAAKRGQLYDLAPC